jgi:hypothetical protein
MKNTSKALRRFRLGSTRAATTKTTRQIDQSAVKAQPESIDEQRAISALNGFKKRLLQP